jgi:hypothetical protein
MPVYPGAHNEHRPHRSLKQRSPLATQMASEEWPIADVIDLNRARRHDLLGRLIHEYALARNSTRRETGSPHHRFTPHAHAGLRE